MIDEAAPAMFGGVLRGTCPVRYIYVDEAGTSAREPASIVVGVIVNADAHWVRAEKAVRAVLSAVPESYRKGFIFHAKSIWGDHAYRDGWPLQERLDLIKAMAAIPRQLGLSIAMAKVRRDSWVPPSAADFGMTPAEWQHSSAFRDCMVRADVYLRENCPPGEIGTVVAEDCQSMRAHLRLFFEVGKVLYTPHLPPNFFRPTEDEIRTGRMRQRHVSGIERIKDGVHFADKSSAPLLQIADACAFSFRRCLAGQSRGVEMVAAMGIELNLPDWEGPSSSSLWTTDPELRSQPHRVEWG